jgi:hypothetical protein
VFLIGYTSLIKMAKMTQLLSPNADNFIETHTYENHNFYRRRTMDITFAQRVATHLHAMHLGVRVMEELAPGIIAVSGTPWLRWDAYYDMNLWTSGDDAYFGLESPEMKGIGAFPGARYGLAFNEREELSSYAARRLTPSRGELDWYTSPKKISLAELGAAVMARQEEVLRDIERDRDDMDRRLSMLRLGIANF